MKYHYRLMSKGASNRRRLAGVGHRPAHQAWTALLLVVVLSGTVLGIGHQHPDDELADEHQCVVCHVQQMTVEPTSFAATVWSAALCARVSDSATEPIERLVARHAPPLRGPPVA